MDAKSEQTSEKVNAAEQATRDRLRKELLDEMAYYQTGQQGSEEAFDKAIMTLCPLLSVYL